MPASLPPLREEPAAEPPARAAGSSGDALVPALPVAPAGGVRVFERMPARELLSHTPPVLDMMLPEGAKVAIDLYALRWKGRYHAFQCSKGWFTTGLNRKESLDFVLALLWAQSGKDRPAGSYVDSVPRAEFLGALDDIPGERPKKRQRVGA